MARIYTGIQPSGELHLGNYLGAVRNWVALQRQHETIVGIVDLHAVTQPYEHAALAQRTLDMAVGLLAAGIDPARSILMVQSHVPQHTELMWVLNNVTPLGELERMTQFKEKAQRTESVPAGLLNYPILMAADILLYKATLVPVGDDQVQHLELAREIARRFNARFGREVFPEPQPLLTATARLVGLDGQAKMSKSLGNTIGILEPPEAVWEKLRPAVTDPARKTKKDPGEPARCPVIYPLHQAFSPPDTVALVERNCRSAGWGCLDCKKALADHLNPALAPIRARAAELAQRPGEVQNVLADGARRCREIAEATMEEVRGVMGFLRPAR